MKRKQELGRFHGEKVGKIKLLLEDKYKKETESLLFFKNLTELMK